MMNLILTLFSVKSNFHTWLFSPIFHLPVSVLFMLFFFVCCFEYLLRQILIFIHSLWIIDAKSIFPKPTRINYSVIYFIQMLNLKSNMQCNKQLRFCLTFLLVYLLHAKLKNHLVQFNIHEFHYIDSFRFFRAQIHASRFFFYLVWLVIIFEMLSTTIITKKKKNCLE